MKRLKANTKLGLLTSLFLLINGCAANFQSYQLPSYLQKRNYDKQLEMANLRKAQGHYQRIAGKPWPPIYLKGDLRPGQKNSSVPAIRQRLTLLGDLSASNTSKNPSTTYDSVTAGAMEHFQRRHGLVADGIIDSETLAALNVTPNQRLRQIQKNIQRWSRLPSQNTPYFVLVNIPSFEVNVIENGENTLHMKAIVGKPDWPTPVLRSHIKLIVLNPTWNVPQDIAEEDIIERVVKNPNYLKENNIKVLTGWGANARTIDPDTIDWQKYVGPKELPYRLKQSAGERNVLGDIKFMFPNGHSVYLHDTPNKRPFSASQRDISHGCVRLNKPLDLLTSITSQDPSLDQYEVMDKLFTDKTERIPLANPVPIYITYLTAWVSPDGELHFRKDIYNKDF